MTFKLCFSIFAPISPRKRTINTSGTNKARYWLLQHRSKILSQLCFRIANTCQQFPQLSYNIILQYGNFCNFQPVKENKTKHISTKFAIFYLKQNMSIGFLSRLPISCFETLCFITAYFIDYPLFSPHQRIFSQTYSILWNSFLFFIPYKKYLHILVYLYYLVKMKIAAF